jgi:hypothetical protein
LVMEEIINTNKLTAADNFASIHGVNPLNNYSNLSLVKIRRLIQSFLEYVNMPIGVHFEIPSDVTKR